MAKIYDTLHPQGSTDELYPNIIPSNNIPNKSIELNKLSDDLIKQFGISSPNYFGTTSDIESLTTNKGLAVATDTGYIWQYDNGKYVNTNYQYFSPLVTPSYEGVLSHDVTNLSFTKNVIYSIDNASTRYSNGELPTYHNGILITYYQNSYGIQIYLTFQGFIYTRTSTFDDKTWYLSGIPNLSLTKELIKDGEVLKRLGTINSSVLLSDSTIVNSNATFLVQDASTRYDSGELPVNQNGILINLLGSGWWTQIYLVYDGRCWNRGRFSTNWKRLDNITVDSKLSTIETQISTLQSSAYNLGMAQALIRAEKRNPFAFKTFDTAKIIVMVDDMYEDFDLIASYCETYNIPLSVSCIPNNLSTTCNGLTQNTGSYTVGMTAKEVCDVIVSLGGEILAHNGSNLVTTTTQYDYDFMYNYFITTKETLESNGFTINGLIQAGGTGAIYGTNEIEKWLIGNYDYSDMGVAVNYNKRRVGMSNGASYIESLIDTTISNNSWCVIYLHRITEPTESGLIEILEYINSHNITPTTYKELFNSFSSSDYLNNKGD